MFGKIPDTKTKNYPCGWSTDAAEESGNIGYPLSSAAVFGMPRMARSRVMGGRFGGEVGRFLLALEEINLLPSPQLPPRIY